MSSSDRLADTVLTVNRARTGEHRDHAAGVIRVDIHAIAAGALGDERYRRRIHFVSLALVDPAHAHVQRALREFELGDIAVEFEQVECAIVFEADAGLAEFKCSTAIAAGLQTIARDQRTIDVGAAPVVLAGRCELDIAGLIGEPGDAVRRICGRGLRGRMRRIRKQDRSGDGGTQKAGGEHDELRSWKNDGLPEIGQRAPNVATRRMRI